LSEIEGENGPFSGPGDAGLRFIYDTAMPGSVAVLLRPGKSPSGGEICNHLLRLIHRLRSYWPTTQLTIRGDGYCGQPEVMAWCEANGVDYILGLRGNAVLDHLWESAADDLGASAAWPRIGEHKGIGHTCVTNLPGSAECCMTPYTAPAGWPKFNQAPQRPLASDRTNGRSPLA
jgi:hypothetical protein